LIQNLIDIKIAHKLINPKVKDAKAPVVNVIDENYGKLNCEIKTLEEKSDEYKLVEEFLENSKSGHKLKLLDVFKLKRDGEDKIFNPNKLANKKLLWHGSRFSNFVGILSQGLRIAPPEAPKSGYLFGKGVYFADMAGKSANYCCSHLSGNVGLFLLCEVALGNTRNLYDTDCDADNLPKGFHSTYGVGTSIPNPTHSKKLEKDIEVPSGKQTINSDKKAHRGYNEFIVYNTNQIRMKYLVKCKFN
jgi:Poly(ADP-ribose) polymerase catalytic domain